MMLTWRREDNQPLEYGNWQQNKNQGIESETTLEGERLTIYKVSRLHMGAYLCIAQNGVPPSVSRLPPMIWIPNQLIGASIGGEVTLDCNTEAFPLSLNYWTKDDNYMIVSSDKFKTSNSEKTYKVHMKLTIKNIESTDFGTYRCYAKNSLGSTQGSIRLYEIHYSSPKEPSTARIQSMNDQVKHKKNIKTSDTLEGEEDYSNSSNTSNSEE
ncbi:unnamed protein product [Medioppia subpectinata]|uniref:Ig-like domain-containing protein n=1 Tax=Medioppia subpectinata TaxID=1979941 RepID=A0A7R9Q6Q9_9ACAR|nr:unnamed protein product [Medioppia subpectinata]CAG2113521.1 unnamed protein product [Medioppia subpectinata]